MAIPKHDEIRIPALLLLQDGKVLKSQEFREPLAKHSKLTEEELNREYESGKGLVFYDRVSWCLSHLNLAGLVLKPKRGFYQISELGLQQLSSPSKINDFINGVIQSRNNERSQNAPIHLKPEPSQFTPTEELSKSFHAIRKAVNNEILETILTKHPREFEKLVVRLLQKMGYGGEIKNAGQVTQASNDGGIDGIIKEDVLGLGRIYIQAKRYARDKAIQRDDIQKFVGALAVVQSQKGVFITTSYYSKGAADYANNLNGSPSLVLIDGEQLADYMYDFGLGMQTEQVIEIKRLDSEFWDLMQDEIQPN
jgi:restriction system protein